MKKSKLVSLILISSALASCETLEPSLYESGATTAKGPDNLYYQQRNPIISGTLTPVLDSLNRQKQYFSGFSLPGNFVLPTPVHIGSTISRGGFGHYGAHMSMSA